MNITYKRNFLIYGIFFSFISLFPESKSKENWKLDMKQSSIQFYVKAKVENVKGTFDLVELKEFEEKENIESLKGNLIVNIDSINTKSKKRDNHLRSKDFFEVEKFPNAIITVKEIRKIDSEYNANITLEIKNKKKDYLIPIEIIKEKSQIKAIGKFQVNRSDFGINGNALTNIIVDNNVDLSFAIVIVK
ncbi:MAG: YceI family protein [Leptospiraceae bacterium]|nr:YceI family protein [Leptospiraceae bacterium]